MIQFEMISASILISRIGMQTIFLIHAANHILSELTFG
jgi:hypothetical protein